MDGRGKPGHDEFSCEITDAENADDKMAVITIIVTGFVGAVWLGIKVMLGK